MKINIRLFLSPQSIPDNKNILYYKKGGKKNLLNFTSVSLCQQNLKN